MLHSGIQLTAAAARLTAIALTHPVVTRLATMPSVGPMTALAFGAALDDLTRFQSAHQVRAYLGLVPSEYSVDVPTRRRPNAHAPTHDPAPSIIEGD